jgi:very-short-patch-repair endonuclease
MTFAEKQLWLRLSSKQLRSLKFRRQHGVGPYIVDFYCPEKGIVIEVDGETHADESQRIKDRERERYLKTLGLQVIRYTNQEVLKNLDGVLEDLNRKVSRDSTSPRPSLQRRGIGRTD